jgi:PAS domain S-box-containing protein
MISSDQTNELLSGSATCATLAETQIEQASTRMAQAKTKTKQAQTGASQAQTRTEQAQTHAEQTRIWDMEKALRVSELSYRRLFEAAQDGILLLDVETGRITDVNPFLIKLLGFSHGEMVGQTVGELSPFKDLVSNQAMLERLQNNGYVRYEDLPLETKDGRKVAVEFVSNVYQAGDKKVIQCNIRDITQRKRAQEAHTRLATAVAQAAETIVITDPKGTILYANPAFEKTSGYTAAEALGQNPRILKSGHQGAEFYRLMWAVLQQGGIWKGNFVNRRKDGTLYEEEASISPVRDASGAVINYVAVKRDVTREVQYEIRLRQSQKMESIGLLAGGIAHDFNNILTAIVGNLYLAKMDAAEHPALLEHLENISVATSRATDLVHQILTFSRQGKQERAVVELNHIVLEALKLLRASVPANIRIQTELTETPAVLANSTAIHQVIMNLGTNAWHAIGDQPGTVKVEIKVMDVDVDFIKARPDLHAGRYVQLSISDTGCGMPPATLEHIFEPFFTTKGVGEGTGLGLAVVHGIMKSHDGSISVYSQPGEGTTFHLYFPVINEELVKRELESGSIPRGAGEHILFVDDEESLAAVGSKILTQLGYTVTMKTSPIEALAAVRDQPEKFAMVITDLTMPGMDGVKLGCQLQAIQPHLPIILTTGFSRVMTEDKALKLGFQALLAKPGTARALGETVHRVLHPTTTAGIRIATP